MNPSNEIYVKLLRKLEPETFPENRDGSFAQNNEIESAKLLSELTELYIKSLAVLRSFGNNPLYFTKIRYGDTSITYHRFEVKIISWLTFYSLCAQLFYIGGFGVLCYRCLSGAYHPSIIPGSGMRAKQSNSTANLLVTAFFGMFFLVCCAGVTISFLTSGKLANFLNKWEDFVFLFSKAFPGQTVDFTRLKCFNYRILKISIFICITYLIWSPIVYRKCLVDIFFQDICTWYEKEQSIMLLGFGCATMINLTWEQTKLAVMMRTAADAFRQIDEALSIHTDNGRPVNTETLREVFMLVYIVRDQVKLIARIVGTSQLFALFYFFGLTILIWMMFLQLSGSDLSTVLTSVIASVGVVQCGRFLATSILVEDILNREKNIVEQVSNLYPRSLKGQIEIQIFLNVLTKRPSEFILNDFITYKRYLFLSIMSNSTSYLIAFQQLLSVSNSDPNTTQISESNTSVILQ